MKWNRRYRKLIKKLARAWSSGRPIPIYTWRALNRAVDDQVERERRMSTNRHYRREKISLYDASRTE